MGYERMSHGQRLAWLRILAWGLVGLAGLALGTLGCWAGQSLLGFPDNAVLNLVIFLLLAAAGFFLTMRCVRRLTHPLCPRCKDGPLRFHFEDEHSREETVECRACGFRDKTGFRRKTD